MNLFEPYTVFMMLASIALPLLLICSYMLFHLQVGSYGGKLKYTISYVAGQRGTQLEDADVQIIVSSPSS